MKSTLILRMAFLSLFFTGLGFFSSGYQLQAQSAIADNIFSIPQGPFAAAAVASQRIDDAIVAPKEVMQITTEGTSTYQAALAKYTCLTTAQAAILAGKGVGESIVDGLLAVHAAESLNMQKSALLTLRQEMIDLLRL